MDSEGAQQAFDELRPLLDAQTDLRRVMIDVSKAAALVAAAGRMVQQPEIRARFAELPKRSFDIRHVENLERSGLALWYAAVQRMRATVTASRSTVPARVIEDAIATRQRMMKVAEYHLGHDQAIAAELADIAAGQGYPDLAADLLRLVPIYEANEHLLRRDPSHYRADDRVRAAALAQRILEYLGQGTTSEDQVWREYVQRAWTFAVNTYEEVATTGRWLFRHEGGEDMFPSLFSILRQAPGSRAGDDADSDQPGDDMAAEAVVAAATDSAQAVTDAPSA